MHDVLGGKNDARIAVLIPCLNEEKTVGKVVSDFRRQLPHAEIYVYDNDSDDGTAEEARLAGAVVRRELQRGKGYAIRRMFREVEAEYYVMVDGDDTYPADQVERLLAPILEGRANMVVGSRLGDPAVGAFRPLHRVGNRLIRSLINVAFRVRLSDVLSGFRAFDREIVKALPLLSGGFEVESEMSMQALDKGYVIAEVPIAYRCRPEGSHSKLSTVKDGSLVLVTMFRILKDYRPLIFLSAIAAFLLVVGCALGALPILEFVSTGIVKRVPTAVLAVNLVILSGVTFSAGLILDSINRRHRELHALVSETIRSARR